MFDTCSASRSSIRFFGHDLSVTNVMYLYSALRQGFAHANRRKSKNIAGRNDRLRESRLVVCVLFERGFGERADLTVWSERSFPSHLGAHGAIFS